MKHHSELIQHLIRLRNLESYLEIGTFNRDHNFNKIKCMMKLCVDPDPNAKADYIGTSDKFFEEFKEKGFAKNTLPVKHIFKFDLIFIDGLHHADQVKKDFENALSVLSDRGFIVMHDCNPPTEITTVVPRGNQREWCGDVYKFACTLLEYTGIGFKTVDFDYGCTVVWKDASRVEPESVGPITWKRFEREKGYLLQLYSVESFLEWTKGLVVPEFPEEPQVTFEEG